MTWHTGTSDGYLELLQDILDLATNSNVDSMAVNAGGTGYAVGDVLTVNGGTVVGGHTAAVEVLTLSGSAVATIRIARGGAYTVNPGTAATTTAETGTGTGCTIDTTIATTGWTIDRRTQEAVSATIGSGGTGYTVSDQITVAIGAGAQGKAGVDAVFNVDTVAAGVITAVSLVTAGNYEVAPTNDALVAGGTGSGAELTITYQNATTQDQVVIMHGTPGGGFTDPYVAIETYTDLDQFLGTEDVKNFALFGLVNYNSLLPLYQQVGISPGHDIAIGDGSYRARGVPNLPLKDTDASFPITFYLSITGRRITGTLQVTDASALFHYPSFYLGFFNQAGTRFEYPYPLYVGGASWRRQAQYAESVPVISGISECCGSQNTGAANEGESSAYFYDPSNAKWYSLMNFDFNDAGTILIDDDDEHRHGIYPVLSPYSNGDAAPRNVFGGAVADAIQFYNELIDRNIPSSPTAQLLPTPNGGTDLYLLIPLTVVAKWTDSDGVGDPTQLDDIAGELDSAFYLSAFPTGGIATLDTFLIGAARYRVFQNGNRTEPNSSYMAIREE